MGSKGRNPPGARLLAIVDAYDSMTSDRPYRKAYPPEEALERLKEGVGAQFDPVLVWVWIRFVEKSLKHKVPAREYA